MQHNCPLCGNETLEERTGVFEMAVPDNIPGGVIQIPNAQWQGCSTCNEEIIPDELSQAIQQERLKRLGLLSPDEIKQIRAKTGLSAVEMAQILGAGDKSYTRWENGKSIQNKSTDTLLRVVDQHPEMFAGIDAQRSLERKPLLQSYFASLETLKGANQTALAAHGDSMSMIDREAIRERLLELQAKAEGA